ncbi:MAG: fumarate hydratase C-terminal domain-containing protein [Desulfatiglandaceae bacterium]
MENKDQKMLREFNLTLPVSASDIAPLKVGDAVFLNGLVFTGREGLYDMIFEKKKEPPIDIRTLGGATINASPTVRETEPGVYHVPSITGTASFRFAKYMSEFLKRYKIRFLIGKGGMSSEVYKTCFQPNGAIYLTTIGYGMGAVYGRGILGVKDVAWKDELGLAQAMWVLEVEKFGPFIVECDTQGASLFEQVNNEINAKFLKLYEGLPKFAMKRMGEIVSAKEEIM